MNMPKISVIIPAYNIEKYITRCLDSLIAQTYQDFETIIVNDGSTDKTPEILDIYAQKHNFIKVIHKENGGVSSARIAGIKAASGDYIGFIDGDDYAEPDMFQLLISNAEKYNADISHCGYQMVFPNGRTDSYYGTGKIVTQDNLQGQKDLLKGEFIEPGLCNKLYKKELVQTIINKQLFDTQIKINEDLLMNFYLFQEAKSSVFEDKCPYHYMIRKNSAATSKINENKLADPLKVLRILAVETKNTPALYDIVQDKMTKLLINLATLPLKDNPELIKKHRYHARKELRQMLKQVLSGHFCSKKVKLMAVWASFLPTSYKIVHLIYGNITGSAKKYQVD